MYFLYDNHACTVTGYLCHYRQLKAVKAARASGVHRPSVEYPVVLVMDKSSSYNITGISVTGRISSVSTYSNVIRFHGRLFPRTDCTHEQYNNDLWWDARAIATGAEITEEKRKRELLNDSKSYRILNIHVQSAPGHFSLSCNIPIILLYHLYNILYREHAVFYALPRCDAQAPEVYAMLKHMRTIDMIPNFVNFTCLADGSRSEVKFKDCVK